jgi:hypothetical protein
LGIGYWALDIVIEENKAFFPIFQHPASNTRSPMGSRLTRAFFKRNPETSEEQNGVFACAGRLSGPIATAA